MVEWQSPREWLEALGWIVETADYTPLAMGPRMRQLASEVEYDG